MSPVTRFLVVTVAAIGFLFDTYELLMLPVIARPALSELLQVPVGSPVLLCRRVTRSADGTPVLLGQYVFPAHRTEFIVDLTDPEASIAPSGLRLVEEGRSAGDRSAAPD